MDNAISFTSNLRHFPVLRTRGLDPSEVIRHLRARTIRIGDQVKSQRSQRFAGKVIDVKDPETSQIKFLVRFPEGDAWIRAAELEKVN